MNEDKNFLEALREKEEEAHSLLFKHFYGYLFRVAFLITKDYQLAEDAVQETFFLIFQKYPQLTDEHKFNAWITKIALNAARLQLRKNRRFPVTVDPALIYRQIEKYLPEELIIQKEEQVTLWQWIEKLPPKVQQTFILHYHYAMSTKEISIATGVPEGTIKSRLNRGRDFLRRKLQKTPAKKPKPGSIEEVSRT